MAEKAAETKEAVAEVTAETVAEEKAENVTDDTDEVAETEIVTVKMAETEQVVKSVEIFWDFSGGRVPT